MKVHILLFAALREKFGKSELDCDVIQGETVASVADRVLGLHANILFAVNDNFADESYVIQDGDTIAFIPPMAGG
jgi:molybdopterin synthase sulfur carrier subunit